MGRVRCFRALVGRPVAFVDRFFIGALLVREESSRVNHHDMDDLAYQDLPAVLVFSEWQLF